MTIEENIIRIREGKNSIITSLQQKGSTISADTLINDIPQFIENLPTSGGGGGGSEVLPPLEQKYEGATCFRINVPTNNYEFSLNLCNDANAANYDIDWGDGTIEHLNTSEQHHTYTESGTYDINVYNLDNRISIGGSYFDTYKGIIFINKNKTRYNSNYIIDEYPDICTDIIIGDNIYSIKQNSFMYLNKIQSVILSDSVTTINGDSFSYCYNLKKFVLSNNLTYFYPQNYLGVEEIVIPDSVQYCGGFSQWQNLKKITFGNNITGIGSFSGCSSLQEIDLSNLLITSIPGDCFANCSSLEKVILPNTITELPWQSFMGTKNLRYISIPYGVTYIGYYCFYNSGIYQIELPETLTTIDYGVFGACNDLYNIISHPLIAPELLDSAYLDGNNYEDMNKYIYIHKNADIDSYTNNWADFFDKGWQLKFIEDMPNEIKETSLKFTTDQNINTTIDRINNSNLINSEVIDNDYTFTFDKEFENLPRFVIPYQNIIDITLPDTIKYFHNEQFRDFRKLQHVNIPQNITEITDDCFHNTSLEEVDLPKSITKLGKYVFYGTPLKKIISRNTIAPQIVTVSQPTFYGIQYYGTLVIPEGSSGYEEENSEWFKRLINNYQWTIEYLPQPNNEIWYTTTDGNIVEPYALPTDNNLLSNTYENGQGVMVFENDITVLADAIFSQQTTLVSVKLPNTLTKINASTFNNCSKLESVNIPNSVTEIGNYAFYNLYKLESIEIPEGVKKIGSNSFRGDIFESITLPSTINSIGNYGFSDMENLYNITSLNSKAPTIQQFTFYNIGRNATQPKVLRIPEGSSGYEETTSQWYKQLILNDWTIEYIKEGPNNNEIWYKSGDGNIINPTRFESLPTILSNTYDTNNNMGTIVCESDITTIGYECFDSNENLIEINLPSSVTNLDQWAFFGTRYLHSLTFNSTEAPTLDGGTSVWSDMGAFSNNEKVIYIPNNANTDSYINGADWSYVYQDRGFVLKNFDGELLYSVQ